MAQLENGYPFDSTLFSDAGDIPLVRIRDLVAPAFETYIPMAAVPARVMIADGDIVIGMDGDFNVVRWNRGPAALNQRLCRLRPVSGADIRFVAYALPNPLEYLHETQYATTVKHLSSAEVLAARIPRPPVVEQRRIADYLDDQVARIDNMIAARQAQSSLIDQQRRVQLDHAIAAIDRPAARLALFARVQSGITVDGGREEADAVDAPYLRVANVQAGELNLREVKTIRVAPSTSKRFALRHGDVLMTEGGDIDKLGRGTVWRSEIPDAIHQNHVFAVRLDQKLLMPEYLAYATAATYARDYFELTGNKTTNLASTSATKVLDFRIPARPLAEQARVVREIAASNGHAQIGKRLLETSTRKLSELKRSLITAAVSGDFDVSSADGSQVPVPGASA